jgi:hypothetical protein
MKENIKVAIRIRPLTSSSENNSNRARILTDTTQNEIMYQGILNQDLSTKESLKRSSVMIMYLGLKSPNSNFMIE